MTFVDYNLFTIFYVFVVGCIGAMLDSQWVRNISTFDTKLCDAFIIFHVWIISIIKGHSFQCNLNMDLNLFQAYHEMKHVNLILTKGLLLNYGGILWNTYINKVKKFFKLHITWNSLLCAHNFPIADDHEMFT